jgi:hypothetical protein
MKCRLFKRYRLHFAPDLLGSLAHPHGRGFHKAFIATTQRRKTWSRLHDLKRHQRIRPWIAISDEGCCTMTADTGTYVLPSALTFEACDDLHVFLLKAQGRDVVLDGSGVTRLGGLAAQMLATASIAWAAGGCRMTLADASDDLQRGLDTLALWPLPQQQGVM